jgi:hypothetical protein
MSAMDNSNCFKRNCPSSFSAHIVEVICSSHKPFSLLFLLVQPSPSKTIPKRPHLKLLPSVLVYRDYWVYHNDLRCYFIVASCGYYASGNSQQEYRRMEQGFRSTVMALKGTLGAVDRTIRALNAQRTNIDDHQTLLNEITAKLYLYGMLLKHGIDSRHDFLRRRQKSE